MGQLYTLDIEKTGNYKLKSGKVIKINPVSPLLVMDVAKSLPKPKPPLVEVDYGDGGKKLEHNTADTNYQEELLAWEEKREIVAKKLTLIRGIDVDIDLTAVKELREFTKELSGVDLDANDKYVYITYILIPDPTELQTIITLISNGGQPTADNVGVARDAFRDNVKG